MDLSATFDIYCERLGPELWAEPWNALSNLSFFLGAIWAGWRLRGAVRPMPYAWALVACLCCIGIGSGLFHTFATGWAALADVLPILAYVLVAIAAVARTVFGWSMMTTSLCILAFFPYAVSGGWLASQVPGLAVSSGYWPIAVLIFATAATLWSRAPHLARGLVLAGGLLLMSLTLRSVDIALCSELPRGTHFLWHLLNGALLAIVIDAYRRQVLAARPTQG